jgi:hypothetical protein
VDRQIVVERSSKPEKMQAHTIHNDFRGAAEPNEVFAYDGLPDLVV